VQGPAPTTPEPDEDELLRQKRQQKQEDVSAAVLRARQRREDEERKMEEQRRAGANERLRQLDEKTAKKDKVNKNPGSNVVNICWAHSKSQTWLKGTKLFSHFSKCLVKIFEICTSKM
jgi:beta-phosphoglucomutase-like phosphatase (HAD superfamily)